MNCAGKVVLVVGGTRGIGRATAIALVAEGARVVITGRSSDAVDKAVSELAGEDIEVDGLTLDLSDTAAALAVVDRVGADAGRIDGLVVAAGISPYYLRAEDLTPAMWDEVMAVNLRG